MHLISEFKFINPSFVSYHTCGSQTPKGLISLIKKGGYNSGNLAQNHDQPVNAKSRPLQFVDAIISISFLKANLRILNVTLMPQV